MQSSVLQRPSRVIAARPTFLRGTPRVRAGNAAIVGKESLPLDELSIDPFNPKSIDAVAEVIVRREGYRLADLKGLTLTIFLEPKDAPGEEHEIALAIRIRRDRNGRTFTAETNVTKAWGHGETIGQAFVDCFETFLGHTAILYEHRNELSPALQHEADQVDAWQYSHR